MVIDKHTKIAHLLKMYPDLKEKLIAFNPKFKNLNNPIVFNTVGKFASLSDVSKVSGMDVDTLIGFIKEQIGSLADGESK